MINYKNICLLYTDDVIAYQKLFNDEILEFLEINEIDPTPNAQEEAAYELIAEDWTNLMEKLKKFDNKNQCKIYVSASLGLWYGRRSGWRVYDNLYQALTDNTEEISAVYFSGKNKTLQLDASHHDGSNYFKFYKIIKGKKYAIKKEEFLAL